MTVTRDSSSPRSNTFIHHSTPCSEGPDIYSRECRDDRDFEAIRQLLIESYGLNQRFHNWWLERIEGNRYHRPVKGGSTDWRTNIRLWFTDEDKLVGVVNPEGDGVAFIQIHPHHRHLESEMVEWAEGSIAHTGEDGVKRLSFWVYGYDEERQRLRPVVAFDVLINNADRKGGHILLGSDNHLWLIDHGVCFHQDYKLRTVAWDFVGEPIPEVIINDLDAFRHRLATDSDLYAAYAALLSQKEIEAMTMRAEYLISDGHFPEPDGVRPYPWPLV